MSTVTDAARNGVTPPAASVTQPPVGSPIRVAVLIPSADSVATSFLFAMLGLMRVNAFVHAGTARRFQFFTLNSRGSILPGLRCNLAEHALARGADFLCYLDSDETFPPDAIARLLRDMHEHPDAGVVGAVYPGRMQGNMSRSHVTGYAADGSPISLPVETLAGVRAVPAVPGGAMMIRACVLENLTRPWFEFGYDAERRAYIAEDDMFCFKVREAGWKVYADYDLSQQFAHIGSFAYSADESADIETVRSVINDPHAPAWHETLPGRVRR